MRLASGLFWPCCCSLWHFYGADVDSEDGRRKDGDDSTVLHQLVHA